MEQDIVNNLKSRVKKLEEELVKVVSTLQKALFDKALFVSLKVSQVVKKQRVSKEYHKSSGSKEFPSRESKSILYSNSL